MKKSSFQFLSVFFISIVLCGSGCVATHSTDNKDTVKALKVGVSTNAPPLIYKEGSRITGLEADLAQQFADYLKRPVKLVTVPWDKQIDYLIAGKTDIIMSGMTVTKKRQYRIDFTSPYLKSGQLLLSRTKNRQNFNKGIYSLMNSPYTIGVVKGTVGEYLVTKTINSPKLEVFNKSKDAVKALNTEKIDVFVYDAPMNCYYAAMNEEDKLSVNLNMLNNEYLAWGISKNNNDLLLQANSFIKQIDNDGILKKTISRWIPYM